jgi:hypothetical protein
MTDKLQFQGFLNTPSLWIGNSVFEMDQLVLPDFTLNETIPQFDPKLRLGKLVENFVFEVLNQDSSSEVLIENIQIRKEKISIGEIDCILKYLNKLIHLEIVYKFYLYDESLQGSGLHKWIGPNRKDDLIHKLTKLKERQLPLLFKKETRKSIEALNEELSINYKNIQQKVLFKAQLFVPIDNLSHHFPSINNDCIKGFYTNYSGLLDLKSNEFYIPIKRDWLTDPHLNVDWIIFDKFEKEIAYYFNEKRAPMCWLKKPNGTFQKFFVVWWE